MSAEGGPPAGGTLAFPSFSELTFRAEGGDLAYAFRPYWPKGASGVTIGPGYDMKERDAATVEADLVAAGMSAETARRMAQGAGLATDEAEQWVEDNRQTFAPITLDISRRLFVWVYTTYVKRAAQTVTAWGGDWDSLSVRMQEVLVDLAFRGDLAKRHKLKLRPAILAADEALLHDALGDYTYWQDHTNLPAGQHGTNARIVQRAEFLTARGPTLPATLAVSAAPKGALTANAVPMRILVKVKVTTPGPWLCSVREVEAILPPGLATPPVILWWARDTGTAESLPLPDGADEPRLQLGDASIRQWQHRKVRLGAYISEEMEGGTLALPYASIAHFIHLVCRVEAALPESETAEIVRYLLQVSKQYDTFEFRLLLATEEYADLSNKVFGTKWAHSKIPDPPASVLSPTELEDLHKLLKGYPSNFVHGVAG